MLLHKGHYFIHGACGHETNPRNNDNVTPLRTLHDRWNDHLGNAVQQGAPTSRLNCLDLRDVRPRLPMETGQTLVFLHFPPLGCR